MATSRRNPRPGHALGTRAGGSHGGDHRGAGTRAVGGPGGADRPDEGRTDEGRPPGNRPVKVTTIADRAPGDGMAGDGTVGGGPAGGRPGGLPRLPAVRLASRDELAASARVAPLLRSAREVALWTREGRQTATDGTLTADEATAAMTELELTPAELGAAWRVAAGTGMLDIVDGRAVPGERVQVLAEGTPDEILATWDAALARMLAAEDLDGMATALYTVGGPVHMDELFEAYAAAAGAGTRAHGAPDGPAATEFAPGTAAGPVSGPEEDHTAGLSSALEALADLGVVELGTEEAAGGLTVTLSRLGVWGMHRHLRAQGWHVPVLGSGVRGDAATMLATLANCDIEDGEAEIAAWLALRDPAQAAAELIDAARNGTPGMRGAGFAVLDRIGPDAVPAARDALTDPVVRAHAAVWLHEHGEDADLGPQDRAWLLVDLGAGLLEEADPADVVVELLPDLPPEAQADLVAGLWEVSHPAVTELLTALSDHHPDPAVARAARKAAFKARSPSAGARSRHQR